VRFLIGLLLLAPAVQEETPKFVPGDATPARWSVSGPSEEENGAELNFRARRLTRRWDAVRKQFTESLSDMGTLRCVVTVADKRFEGSLRAGVPGRYGVTLSNDTKQLHAERLALGPVARLFERTPDDVKILLEAIDKAGEFLDEIERILGRQEGHSEKHRDDFLKRVAAWGTKVDELLERSDLTGSILVLRDVYFHVRNVQIWEESKLPPTGSNDPVRQKKKLFLDLDLTIEALRKTLAALPGIISSEIKVSTTMIVERLVAQARDIEPRRESARAAARAASKLAEVAPVPDKDLVSLLDQASDRTSDPEEIRTQLLQAGRSLIVQ